MVQSHKRLMLLGTVGLTEAGVARRPIPAPLVAWDFASRRRLHPATPWGGLAVIAQGPVRDWLAKTDAWMAFASWATGMLS